jgi:hypothetical protein
MTYLEARRIEGLFKDYRQLVVNYWAAVEWIDYGGHGWMAGAGAPLFRDTQTSLPLREEIARLLPQMEHWATKIGAGVRGSSYPTPAVGGPVIPFNLLACATDLWVGHRYVQRQDVLDAIDRCIGSAGFVKRRILARLMKPWCWLIDVPALIVYWPFAVMRKAGVSDKIVESTGAQIIKAILTTALSVIVFAWTVYTTGIAAAIQGLFKHIAGGP